MEVSGPTPIELVTPNLQRRKQRLWGGGGQWGTGTLPRVLQDSFPPGLRPVTGPYRQCLDPKETWGTEKTESRLGEVWVVSKPLT